MTYNGVYKTHMQKNGELFYVYIYIYTFYRHYKFIRTLVFIDTEGTFCKNNELLGYRAGLETRILRLSDLWSINYIIHATLGWLDEVYA